MTELQGAPRTTFDIIQGRSGKTPTGVRKICQLAVFASPLAPGSPAYGVLILATTCLSSRLQVEI